MAADSELIRSDNFFGELKTERCTCGHGINVTDPVEHTCNQDCDCESCRSIIRRQLRVLEED